TPATTARSSRAIPAYIEGLRRSYEVVTFGSTRTLRFSFGNGFGYARSTRLAVSIPRRSAYIAGGCRVPLIRMLAWTAAQTQPERIDGSRSLRENFPPGPPTHSR